MNKRVDYPPEDAWLYDQDAYIAALPLDTAKEILLEMYQTVSNNNRRIIELNQENHDTKVMIARYESAIKEREAEKE